MLQPVQIFKALADQTRLTIIMLLKESGELCVCNICAVTAESQPKISRHMALLREAGLVADHRKGKWVHYSLSSHMPVWAATIIDSAWTCERASIQKKLKNAVAASC